MKTAPARTCTTSTQSPACSASYRRCVCRRSTAVHLLTPKCCSFPSSEATDTKTHVSVVKTAFLSTLSQSAALSRPKSRLLEVITVIPSFSFPMWGEKGSSVSRGQPLDISVNSLLKCFSWMRSRQVGKQSVCSSSLIHFCREDHRPLD